MAFACRLSTPCLLAGPVHFKAPFSYAMRIYMNVHMNVDMIVGSMCTFLFFVVRFPLLKS